MRYWWAGYRQTGRDIPVCASHQTHKYLACTLRCKLERLPGFHQTGTGTDSLAWLFLLPFFKAVGGVSLYIITIDAYKCHPLAHILLSQRREGGCNVHDVGAVVAHKNHHQRLGTAEITQLHVGAIC